MRGYILYLVMLILALSCDEKAQKESIDNEPPIHAITVNFNENIQSLDPLKARSDAERFVCDLVYDRLLKNVSRGDIESDLVEKITFDSTSLVYHFKLKDNIRFNKTTEFTTENVRELFISIYKTKRKDVKAFFNLIKPRYGSSLGLKELPFEINFLDEHQFSVQVKDNSGTLLETLTSKLFSIHLNGEGTGPFIVENLNDDISCSLIRKQRDIEVSNIHNIELRFIKNKDEEILEFLEGNIDLFQYSGLNSKIETYKNYLNELILEDYPDYQIHKSKQSTFRYVKVYGLQDSSSISKLEKSFPKSKRQDFMFKSNFAIRPLESDSNAIAQIFYNDIYAHSLSKTNIPDEISDENNDLNPKKSVFKEIELKMYNGDPLLALSAIYKIEMNNNERDEKWIILLVDEQPTYYISHFYLKGMKNYRELSDLLHNVNIERPIKY